MLAPLRASPRRGPRQNQVTTRVLDHFLNPTSSTGPRLNGGVNSKTTDSFIEVRLTVIQTITRPRYIKKGPRFRLVFAMGETAVGEQSEEIFDNPTLSGVKNPQAGEQHRQIISGLAGEGYQTLSLLLQLLPNQMPPGLYLQRRTDMQNVHAGTTEYAPPGLPTPAP